MISTDYISPSLKFLPFIYVLVVAVKSDTSSGGKYVIISECWEEVIVILL